MKETQVVKISFTGDLMCLKEQNEAIRNTQPDEYRLSYDRIFENVKPLFQDVDLLVGNLETPVSSRQLSSEAISFNTPVEFVDACANCGFGFVSTANNHCLDRGIEGLEETIQNLNKVGIRHSGTYVSRRENESVSVLDIDGLKIGFICATFGTNSEYNGIMLPPDEIWRVDLLKRQNKPARVRFNPGSPEGRKMISDNVTSAAITNSANHLYIDKYLNKIEEAKKITDIVIVLPHIGGQYNPYPGTYTRYITRLTASTQPSYVVCNHPHVPQHIALVDGVPIAYSLGNFSFTPDTGYYLSNSLAEYGIILHTYWDKCSGKLVRSTFTITKNVVDDEGVAVVYPVGKLLALLSSPIDKERLEVEVHAVANRFASSYIANPFAKEIELTQIPEVKG